MWETGESVSCLVFARCWICNFANTETLVSSSVKYTVWNKLFCEGICERSS